MGKKHVNPKKEKYQTMKFITDKGKKYFGDQFTIGEITRIELLFEDILKICTTGKFTKIELYLTKYDTQVMKSIITKIKKYHRNK